MKNLRLIPILIFIYSIGLLASDQCSMTALQKAAIRGDVKSFAIELACGADPDEKFTITLTGYEYNRVRHQRQTVREFLERSTKVSSAHTIDRFTAEKMLTILSIRSSLISYFYGCHNWDKLNFQERLEQLTAESTPKNQPKK